MRNLDDPEPVVDYLIQHPAARLFAFAVGIIFIPSVFPGLLHGHCDLAAVPGASAAVILRHYIPDHRPLVAIIIDAVAVNVGDIDRVDVIAPRDGRVLPGIFQLYELPVL